MDLKSYLPAWKAAMLAGEIGGRAFSILTAIDYNRRIELLLAEYGALDIITLKTALRAIPTHQLGKYTKLYKAAICFAKYLNAENIPIDPLLVVKKGVSSDQLAGLRRHTNKAPKQITVSAANLKKLKKACVNDFERLVITLLSTTGLRASEACALNVSDCDLSELTIYNIKGKGGKTRKAALTTSCAKAITDYLLSKRIYNGLDNLLIDADGKAYNRYDLNRLLNEIGKRVSVEVTPHALRRAFVTISHAAGAPLDYLRMSCDHSDIKTTMGYCKTKEVEVLDFMRNLEIIPDES